VTQLRGLFHWFAAFIAGIVYFGATRMPPAQAADLTTVRAAYIPVINWLPAWVAKDKHIFEQNGLDVSLTLAQNVSLLPAKLGRQFDLVPSTPPDLIKAVVHGLDVVAIAGEAIETWDNPSTHLIVRHDSSIKSIQDLKGKIVASPTLSAIIHASLLDCLKQNGIDPSTIHGVEVPFPDMGDQLRTAKVDAVEVLEPFAGQLLAAGNLSLGDPLLCVGDAVIFAFWISQGQWAAKNPAVIAAWITSLTQAKAFIGENPHDARAILAKYTKLPPPVVDSIPMPTFHFAIKPEDFSVWVSVLKDLGQVTQQVDTRRLVMPTN
jgi:NitT/TauT family transport system substrate-binding protein